MKKYKHIFLIFIVVFVMMPLASCGTKKIQEECLNYLKERNNYFELLESKGELYHFASDEDGKHGFSVEFIPENNKYITIRKSGIENDWYQLTPTSDVDIEIPVKLVFTPFENNNQEKFERNVTFLMYSKSYYYDYYFEKNEVYGKNNEWHSRSYNGKKEWYYSSKKSSSSNDWSKYTSNVEITLYLKTMEFNYRYKYTKAVDWG